MDGTREALNVEGRVSAEVDLDVDVGDYAPEGFVEKSLHPRIRPLLSPPAFTVVVCLFGVLMSGVTTGLFSSSGGSVQRSLGLTATDWGLISTLFEVFAVGFTVITAYYGGRSHLPRYLSLCLMIFSLGCVLFTAPHFAFYRGAGARFSSFDICSVTSVCSEGQNTQKTATLLVFLAAQLCIALGSALWILGPIYLDRHVCQSSMNLYLSCLYASAALGPAVGFLMNGALLDRWVSPWEEAPSSLTPDSPIWTGNWWIGYLIFGAVGLVCVVPLSLFPRYLPGTVEVRKAKLKSRELVMDHDADQKTTMNVESSARDQETPRGEKVRKFVAKDFKTFSMACKDILGSFMRVFTMLAHGTENFAVSALSTFLPQIIQAQFGITPGLTSIIFGVTIVIGAVSGIAFGGWFVKWRNYDGVQTARFCFIIACVSLPLSFSFLLLGCPGNTVFPAEEDDLILFAEDLCESPNTCRRRLALFIVLLFLLMFTTFSNNVPGSQVILRSTELKERPLAMALNSTIARLTGSIPAPLLFGLGLDRLCLVHSSETCNGGTCLLADNTRVKYLALIVSFVFKSASAIFLLLAWRFYKKNQACRQIASTSDSSNARLC